MRSHLVKELISRTRDPDTAVGDWLVQGAPLGLLRQIPPGGLFPAKDPEDVCDMSSLEAAPAIRTNHPSFKKQEPSAMAQLSSWSRQGSASCSRTRQPQKNF